MASFLYECLLGNMSEHLPSPQLLCGGAHLIIHNDSDLYMMLIDCSQEIIVALNEIISQTVLKQEHNLSFYLYLSEAFYGFSCLFCGYPFGL